MVFLIESSLRSFLLLFSFFRRPIWLHSWHFYHKHAVKELSTNVQD